MEEKVQDIAETVIKLSTNLEDALIEMYGMYLFLVRKGLWKEYLESKDVELEVRQNLKKAKRKLEAEGWL